MAAAAAADEGHFALVQLFFVDDLIFDIPFQLRVGQHDTGVAFGTLCHMMLENAPTEELVEVLDFCLDVGLPVCLADIGVESISHFLTVHIFVGAGQDGQAVHDAVGRRQTAALKAQAGQQDVGLNDVLQGGGDDVHVAGLAADKLGSTYKQERAK